MDLDLSGVLTSAASGERLALALEAGGMGTWDWDLVSGRIRWDSRTAAIFGIRLEDHFHVTETGAAWFTQPQHSIDRPFGWGAALR